MWSVWLVFCIVVSILSALWWIRIRGLGKLTDGRNSLRGKVGLVLIGGAMPSKSLIQFFWWAGLCSLPLVWPSYGEDNEDNGNLLQRGTAVLIVPDPAAGHCEPMPPLETPGHSWANLGQSLVGSLLLAPGSWCTQGFVCALQESISPILCKFWQLSGGYNGNLLQEGLRHTHVCCTQSSCPCSRPLLTRTSRGDTQTLKGRSGSVSVGYPGEHKVLFESSECLWWVWGLILNMISPLLPSCWGFSLPLDIGYLFLVGSYILLLMVVWQWVVISEFLKEKMSICPYTQPSWEEKPSWNHWW